VKRALRRLASYPKHDLKPDYEGFAFCAPLRAAEAGHRPAICAPDYPISPRQFSTSFMSPSMPDATAGGIVGW
jgi:hypothetical protein